MGSVVMAARTLTEDRRGVRRWAVAGVALLLVSLVALLSATTDTWRDGTIDPTAIDQSSP